MRDCFIILIFSCPIFIITGAGHNNKSGPCHEVQRQCEHDSSRNVPLCIETHMRRCSRKQGRRPVPVKGYYSQQITHSAAMLNTAEGHTIHIPSEALQKIRTEQEGYEGVDLIVSVLNKTFFRTHSGSEVVHGQNVLGVWLGVNNIHNLSESVQLRFRNTSQTENGTCVYWHLDENGEGDWSTEGCSTGIERDEVVCSCNHLSFLQCSLTPKIPEETHIVHLSYISYIGSALSIVFTAIVIVTFLWQRKKQRESSVVVHAQLAGSLFLLHISFLCSVWFSGRGDEVCVSLGLLLHWCLLVTFSWTAIEGFHLYLLLVRVFNIYIKRYLLKLSLVAWGVPTVTVMICGITGKYVSVYGKYALHEGKENPTSASICWITTQTVSLLTVNGYLGLVMIFNMVMLGVVLVKMRQLRSQDRRVRNSKRQVWKDWVSLLGLCCVLGVPWTLAFFTHAPLSLPALYLFTLLNSFQGVFIFLWFFTVTCQTQKEEHVSSKGTIQVNFQSHAEHVTTSLVNNIAEKN